MESIVHTYTIQWVGPFLSYEELKEHCKNGRCKNRGKEATCSDPGLFSFYFFSGNKKWKREQKFAYFGMHTGKKSITDRLNKSHEHFKKFHNNKNLQIWIGSFANDVYQEDWIIDFVETIFINRYKIELNDNKNKKAKPFEIAVKQSFVIVNLWYDTNEKPYRGRNLVPFEDVITYEVDTQRLLTGVLHKKRLDQQDNW